MFKRATRLRNLPFVLFKLIFPLYLYIHVEVRTADFFRPGPLSKMARTGPFGPLGPLAHNFSNIDKVYKMYSILIKIKKLIANIVNKRSF